MSTVLFRYLKNMYDKVLMKFNIKILLLEGRSVVDKKSGCHFSYYDLNKNHSAIKAIS